MKKGLKHIVRLSLVAGFGWGLGAGAESAQKVQEGFVSGVCKTADGVEIPYQLFRPAAYDPIQKYPLILALHGLGARGTDNQRQIAGEWVRAFAKPDIQKRMPCFIFAPQCNVNSMWVENFGKRSYSVDGGRTTPELAAAFETLHALMKEYSIDPARIYITGNSMGGHSTWFILQKYPGVFAAGIPCAGGGDVSKARELVTTPITAVHGDADTIVPYEGSKNIIAAILEQGGTCATLKTVAGGGHDAQAIAYTEDLDRNGCSDLAEWMLSQTNPQPMPLPHLP